MSCHIFSFFTISNYREHNFKSYGIKIEMYVHTFLLIEETFLIEVVPQLRRKRVEI